MAGAASFLRWTWANNDDVQLSGGNAVTALNLRWAFEFQPADKQRPDVFIQFLDPGLPVLG